MSNPTTFNAAALLNELYTIAKPSMGHSHDFEVLDHEHSRLLALLVDKIVQEQGYNPHEFSALLHDPAIANIIRVRTQDHKTIASIGMTQIAIKSARSYLDLRKAPPSLAFVHDPS